MHWKDFEWLLIYRDYFCRGCLFCTFKKNLTFCLRFLCVMSKNTTPVFLYWMCQIVYELNKHAGLASGRLLQIPCWLSFCFMFCKWFQLSCQHHISFSWCFVFNCAMCEVFLISCGHFDSRPTLTMLCLFRMKALCLIFPFSVPRMTFLTIFILCRCLELFVFCQ